jgi:hypothetical protein
LGSLFALQVPFKIGLRVLLSLFKKQYKGLAKSAYLRIQIRQKPVTSKMAHSWHMVGGKGYPKIGLIHSELKERVCPFGIMPRWVT